MRNRHIQFVILGSLLLFISCQSAPDSPAAVMRALVEAAVAEDIQAMEELMSRHSLDLLDEYRVLVSEINATGAPANPTYVLMHQFQEMRPEITGGKIIGSKAILDIKYRNGMSAKLEFVLEDSQWKFNLAEELKSAVQLMRNHKERLLYYKKSLEERKSGKTANE